MTENMAAQVLKNRIQRVESMGLPFIHEGVCYFIHTGKVFCRLSKKTNGQWGGLPKHVHIMDGTEAVELYGFAKAPIEEVTLPNTVHDVGSAAFAWCERLRVIHLGNRITHMGSEVFNTCTRLESLDLRGYRNYKPPSCLCLNCHSLKEVWLPDCTLEIQSYTFQNCYSLAKVHLPQGVKIAHFAFGSDRKACHHKRIYYD